MGTLLPLLIMVGVDACNTILEVLLFAAATNLGQSWKTVLTLFGGAELVLFNVVCPS